MATYGTLVRTTGTGFLATAFLARLPAAMAPLGVITLVAATTGSFGVAGAVAAAYGVGAAVGGPVVGRLADRFGQRRTGLAAAVLDALALIGIVAAVAGGAAPVVAGLLAAAAGFANPQIGPLVRVRWAVLLGDRGQTRTLPTAFSYEGAADELSFMAGPALVGLLALTGAPGVPLVVAAILTVLFAIPFAMHHTAPPVLRVPAAQRRAEPLPGAALGVLVLAMLAIGVVFGGTQTAVTAYAESAGTPGAAGLIYAVLGVGSAAAGVATAWLPARIGPVTRYLMFAAALAVGGGSAYLLSGSFAGMIVAMLLVGVTSAPYLITVNALANLVAPRGRAGTVMTLVASGVVAGVALGAAVAGHIADSSGSSGAFAVPAVAGVAAALLALAATRLIRRATGAGPRKGDGTTANDASPHSPGSEAPQRRTVSRARSGGEIDEPGTRRS
ncbi:MFS transporter [Hamadaea tsunoensis]|uniref:MFS transporter n=1 Tax=Hamadaea tsunoensis TaxID=53368 RepID=UPI0003FB58F6|nr:MFS transporter [Hamadaea tsunoensis]